MSRPVCYLCFWYNVKTCELSVWIHCQDLCVICGFFKQSQDHVYYLLWKENNIKIIFFLNVGREQRPLFLLMYTILRFTLIGYIDRFFTLYFVGFSDDVLGRLRWQGRGWLHCSIALASAVRMGGGHLSAGPLSDLTYYLLAMPFCFLLVVTF